MFLVETLKNLQVILDDSDDDPEGDVITYQSPCPIPVVNFIELSSDSGGNDDEEEKIDVTTGTGDVTNKFRKGDNQVSIRNIDVSIMSMISIVVTLRCVMNDCFVVFVTKKKNRSPVSWLPIELYIC